MVFPSTHDRATDSPKGLFESSPAGAALDDTRPFSLSNALLADMPEAGHYGAPAFQPLPKPVVIDEPTAGQMAAKLLRNEGFTGQGEKPVTEPAIEDPGLVAQEPDTTPTSTERKIKEKPRPRSTSWPRHGFLSRTSRPRPSANPLNKAIRIFASLSQTESLPGSETERPEVASEKPLEREDIPSKTRTEVPKAGTGTAAVENTMVADEVPGNKSFPTRNHCPTEPDARRLDSNDEPKL